MASLRIRLQASAAVTLLMPTVALAHEIGAAHSHVAHAIVIGFAIMALAALINRTFRSRASKGDRDRTAARRP